MQAADHIWNDCDISGAILRAQAEAPYLSTLIDRHPALIETLRREGPDAALAEARETAADLPAAVQLRKEKQAVALVTALADLSGLWALERVTFTLNAFADRALDIAITTAIAERTPNAPVQGFAAIALGKHGSGELNYSSDIDPILLFDRRTLPVRPREDVDEAAVRIAQRVLQLLQTRDADGYVFRVDLRLRPSPEVTPIAMSVDAAIVYYESAALAWERAAFIRSRAAAGDIALGRYFLDAVRPFVWRRSLDYGAIREIKAISARIRDHHRQGQLLGPGYDLKRGRGGIREVEFYAQIHQMIFGGREPGLRRPATLDALDALAAAGRVDAEAAGRLADAYRLLRTVEHRLQMVEDRQTHSLPKDGPALDGVARLGGWAGGAALVEALAAPIAAVGTIYDGLAAEGAPDAPPLPHAPDALEATLGQAGFADPAAIRQRIQVWRGFTHRALRSEQARRSFEASLPQLVIELGRAVDPLAAAVRFERFLERLPAGAQFFALLEANPRLIGLLGRLLGHAPTLAEELARRPSLFDGLVDASAFAPIPSVGEAARELAAGEAGDGYERLLDRVRVRVAERRFALGVQLIDAVADPLEVAAGYSRIAEAAIDVLTTATSRDFETRHGKVPGGGLVILGLGRLGGGALTAASDLDLIFLFSGDHATESDGPKPLGATQYFNRLAQRVVAALSVPTASGPLYPVDTRLRPSGAQGLLAVNIDSFAEYQAQSAWTWEHMALTRARVLWSDPAARAATEAVIAETLNRARDPAMLAREVVSMRAEIARHKPPGGALDVKLNTGGLVDLEFAVHHAQLRHRLGFSPYLPTAIAALAAAGVLPERLGEAYDLLTRLLVLLRLAAPDIAETEAMAPETRALIARAAGAEDWNALLAAYATARQSVSAVWGEVLLAAEKEE